jgi:hypothetical protein
MVSAPLVAEVVTLRYMAKGVPLAFRVPNAPATFVGRSDELRAIAAAGKRGPVVVVCGAGGLGKTALATAAVKKARTPRAVMVSARAAEPLVQVLVDVVRALGHPAPREDADLAMLAIDLAERERAVVILDDLHHVLPEATGFLVAAARYARRAKWIATSRVEPAVPELDGQIIRLDPLAERHLASLAKLVDRKLTRVQAAEIAKRAEGSPWKAREIAGRGEHVGESGQALLATLSAVERPISKDALARAVDEDVRALVSDLVRRGLVEAVAGGFRIHEAARALVGEQTAPDRAINALAAGGDADALEALRLALKTKNEKRAREICEASFDEMLHAGHAAALWKLVSSQEGAAWNSYKLRAAMRLADVKITTVLDEPPKEALRDRLLWVRALHVEARAKEALEAAEKLFAAAQKSGDPHVAFWAATERAMAAHNGLGPARGLELLEDVTPIDDATRALATALSAFWHAETGRVDDAVRALERNPRKAALESVLGDEILGGPLDFFVRYYRMAAFMECGHLGRAHAELTAGRDDLDVDDQLRASYVQLDGIANLSIARGKLDDAERILSRLLRSAPSAHHQSATTYHTIARLLDVERRIAAGAFAEVGRDFERLLDETRASNPLVHAWCYDTRERLRVVNAVRDDDAPAPEDLPFGAVARSLLALRHARASARFGVPHDVPDAVDVEGSIVRELVLAEDAIVRDKDAAAVHARRAVDLAVTHGWGVRECEARESLSCALFLAGDVRGALAEARGIGKLAQSMTSRRFDLESRVLVALFDEPRPDVATLEEAAASPDVSPIAARRARAILGGGTVVLDAIDERIVRRARANAEIVRVHAVDGSRGWGLDARRGVVWLPDGRRVSFQRHALLAKVLEVLARQNGTASFEDLAREVWQRKTFHPLNDGTRIRVTLHRLRALVEQDPQKPERVVLSAASYVLGSEPFTLVSDPSNTDVP